MKIVDPNQKMMIPITRPDLPPLENYVEYLRKIWASRWLTNDGEFVRLFERKLAEYLGIKHIILVTNGTLALQLALKVLRLKGEIITTPFTFPATTNVILWEGLTPVFADIDNETFNIDPKEVERKITDKTSAILAVHVYGNPCYVERLQEIADKYSLKLIYDCAHAFGVEYKNQSVLNYGDISTLSFHATKVFTTIEGGAIVVKDQELFDKLKLLRNHGIRSEEEFTLSGINAKMNEFQAAMGLCNLTTIDRKIWSRKKIYEYYKHKLGNINNIKFQKILASRYNYIYMPILLDDAKKRDKIYSELLKNGIKARKYFYPLTVNLKERSASIAEKCDLERACDLAKRVLCLPLYPDLEIAHVDKTIEVVKESSVRMK